MIQTEKLDATTAHQLNKWIKEQEWNYFVTLTTSYESTGQSMRRLNERFHKRAKNVYGKCTLFYVLEKHKHRGYHSHGLLKLEGVKQGEELSSIQFRNLIKIYNNCAGGNIDHHRNSFSLYRSNENAAEYCIKYLTKGLEHWDYLY